MLRHARAGAGRDQAPPRVRPLAAARLRPRRLLPRALDPRRRESDKSNGTDEHWESRHRRAARGRGGLAASKLVPDPGRGRVLRPEDLGEGTRRHRPHLADVDRCSRLQPARALRASSTPTADGSHQQPVMIHRRCSARSSGSSRSSSSTTPGRSRCGSRPCRSSASRSPTSTRTTSAASIDQLRRAGVRAELDRSDDRMQKKIRTHTTQKVPFQLIAGEQDRAGEHRVSFRFRDGTQENGVPDRRRRRAHPRRDRRPPPGR